MTLVGDVTGIGPRLDQLAYADEPAELTDVALPNVMRRSWWLVTTAAAALVLGCGAAAVDIVGHRSVSTSAATSASAPPTTVTVPAERAAVPSGTVTVPPAVPPPAAVPTPAATPPPAAAPPVPAAVPEVAPTNDGDHWYFIFLQGSSLTVTSSSRAAATGHWVCTQMATGIRQMALTDWMSVQTAPPAGFAWTTPVTSASHWLDADGVTASAIIAYCPQYK